MDSFEPIRVAHIMGKMVGGGVESFVMNYFRELSESQVFFDFIVDDDSTFVPYDEIQELGGRVFKVPPYQKLVSNQRSLRKLFKEQDWKIVHSHLNALSVFPLLAAKEAGVPIRISHSHSTSNPSESTRNLLKNCLKVFSDRYPTHKFACSRHAGEWLFGKDATFEIVPNAIVISSFLFNEDSRNKIRRLYDLDEDALIIGHAGRFTTQKNHKLILSIFSLLLEQKPNSNLLLVGDGPLKKEIEECAKKNFVSDKVIFTGQVNNVYEYYSAFDVLLMPSLYEGFGMSALEAQVCGLPCILSLEFPDEIQIASNVRRLDLSSPNSEWVKAITDFETKATRKSENSEAYSRYNISLQANKLFNRYCTLMRYSNGLT